MNHAARIVAEITGCTSDQTQAVITALIERDWSPPGVSSDQPPPMREATSRRLLDELPASTVLTAHTDGACSGNPGPGGWSGVFSVAGAIVGEFSGNEGYTTSNRMELTAVLEAIQRAPLGASLGIVTDSANVVGWLARGWNRNNAAVAALCREIDTLHAERVAAGGGAVTFRHVRGHKGDALNERADKLATGAIRRA
jgi:ribonuclease HI